MPEQTLKYLTLPPPETGEHGNQHTNGKYADHRLRETIQDWVHQ
jgi:hypothetical protein